MASNILKHYFQFDYDLDTFKFITEYIIKSVSIKKEVILIQFHSKSLNPKDLYLNMDFPEKDNIDDLIFENFRKKLYPQYHLIPLVLERINNENEISFKGNFKLTMLDEYR